MKQVYFLYTNEYIWLGNNHVISHVGFVFAILFQGPLSISSQNLSTIKRNTWMKN